MKELFQHNGLFVGYEISTEDRRTGAAVRTLLADPEYSYRGPTQLLNNLAGRWVMNGTIAGKRATHDVDACMIADDAGDGISPIEPSEAEQHCLIARRI